MASPPIVDPPREHSLLRMLSDGSAGAGTRLMASLTSGLLLTAFACLACYVIGMGIPSPSRPISPMPGRTVAYVSDDIAAIIFLMAGVVYLGVLFWIWSRHRRKRILWLGGVMTVGLGILTILLCVVIDSFFAGDEEFLLAAAVFGAIGVALFGWTRLYHRHVGGRALYDQEGVLALRCPTCGYSMVGLREARCPECGQEYTLNDLMARQDFEALRLGRMLAGEIRKSP